ncbi:hypothetical protein [Roseimicrobium sp. ORNL1]|uniref:hypothetical protein n=1 Tax=Roseimicrobium sp. ORNL1 TaxID=2711231 RepID=UPI0013E0F686|nr:hypothetical protein [Roseimicrobium sp. ORNL1]QIF02600.1 hypothetical protein G5S37_14055 [Roseimicrobium sp. ORNL1]
MLTVIAAFAITLPEMAERYYLMSLGLPIISFTLTLGLWAWLLLRTFPLGQLLMMLFVLMDAIAIASSLCIPSLNRVSSADFSLRWALMPLFPALLHLAVEPGRRLWKSVEKKSAPIEMYWVCFALLPAPFIWFTIDRYFTNRERIIAWSWTVVHTTTFGIIFPFVFIPIVPLSCVMAFVAVCQWWRTRSKTESSDDAQ